MLPLHPFQLLRRWVQSQKQGFNYSLLLSCLSISSTSRPRQLCHRFSNTLRVCRSILTRESSRPPIWFTLLSQPCRTLLSPPHQQDSRLPCLPLRRLPRVLAPDVNTSSSCLPRYPSLRPHPPFLHSQPRVTQDLHRHPLPPRHPSHRLFPTRLSNRLPHALQATNLLWLLRLLQSHLRPLHP